jgi:hypothetical protein
MAELFNATMHYGFDGGYPILNEKDDPSDVLVPDVKDGKIVGKMWVPAGAVNDVLNAEKASTTVGQYTKPCSGPCIRRIVYIGAATFAVVATGGELAVLLFGEEGATGLAEVYGTAALRSGGLSLLMRPSVVSASFLALANPVAFTFTEVRIIFLVAEESYELREAGEAVGH